MYVCVYVCMYIYIYIYTYIYTNLYIYIHIKRERERERVSSLFQNLRYVLLHIYHFRFYVLSFLRWWRLARPRKKDIWHRLNGTNHIYIYIYIHTYIYVCMCMHVCMYIYIYIYIGNGYLALQGNRPFETERIEPILEVPASKRTWYPLV